MLSISVTACLFSTTKLYQKFKHPIAITLGKPLSSVPFPAITIIQPFQFDRLGVDNTDFLISWLNLNARERIFKQLNETNQVENFMSQLSICPNAMFLYEIPIKNYERSIVSTLRNFSHFDLFEHQESTWNSRFEVSFVKRLTSYGFAYTFNLIDAEEVLNVHR